MTIQEKYERILEHLYQDYINNGGGRFVDITTEIKALGEDPIQFGQYLVGLGWVENYQYIPNGFIASISMTGIDKIHPEYIDDNTSKILYHLGENQGSNQSIMEILEFDRKDFQRAHHIATYMKDSGTIEAIFGPFDVLLKITLKGKEIYDSSKGEWL